MYKKTCLLILSVFFVGAYLFAQKKTDELRIIQKPIQYNKKRKELSLQYLKDRYGIIQKEPTITPKMIVLHYTAGGTAKSIFNYFNKVEIENARKLNRNQSKLNVSSHFIVDRDGTIYQLMPETRFARHIIGLNYCAIGIENIGSKKRPLTQKQVEANIELIKYLAAKHKIEFLIGHYEYLKFRKTKYWKEKNPKYITYKKDPGKLFMRKVRDKLKSYKFKKEPD